MFMILSHIDVLYLHVNEYWKNGFNSISFFFSFKVNIWYKLYLKIIILKKYFAKSMNLQMDDLLLMVKDPSDQNILLKQYQRIQKLIG